jgi:hypothetical protein
MHAPPLFRSFLLALLLTGCAAAPTGPVVNYTPGPVPPPHVGDTALYQVRNAYNGETLGDVQYVVDRIEGDRVFVAVTASSAYAGLPHTEIYTPDGNWMRHPLSNHDRAIEYEFLPPFPAYAFPLESGKGWSVRVNARNAVTGRTASVRVDGEVLGSERLTTPAGTFDVVKIRRRVYAGDWDAFLRKTNIVETDWYAPALGRSVRLESNSSWLDTSRSPGGGMMGMLGGNQMMRGDWTIRELAGYQVDGKSAGRAAIAPTR